MDSENLVPGDIIIIEDDKRMPCDALLISGEVLVTESVLTGESLPVPKGAVQRSVKKDKQNMLFEGTDVVKSRAFDDPFNSG